MRAYIENMLRQLPKENEGYKYITSETIFIPILKTSLSITTRRIQGLRFVDEMILKLINEGVTASQDIAGYMGLAPDVLDISLADLFAQDYISVSARICRIGDKGRAFLKGESTTKKEIEDMSDVYVNLCSGDIVFSNDGFVSNVHANAYKCAHSIDGDVKFFRQNISVIKESFDAKQIEVQTRSIAGRVITIDSATELLSINSVEKSNVLFKRLRLHFYISDSNNSIDITPANPSDADLVDKLKPYLLLEIQKQKILGAMISSQKDPKLPRETQFESEHHIALRKAITSYYSSKEKQALSDKISNLVLVTRRLLDNELDALVELLSQQAKKVDVYVSGNLHKAALVPDISNAIQHISGVKDHRIICNTVWDFRKAQDSITRSNPSIKPTSIIRQDFDGDIRLVFDDVYTIKGTQYQVPVYGNMHLKYRRYDLEVNA